MKPLFFAALFSALALLLSCRTLQTARKGADNSFAVIAYYAGDGADLDRYRFERLTHVIYSFCHLRGAELAVDNAADTAVIRKLVALKQRYPQLKVQLSLGGWGGCQPCSETFADAARRRLFAQAVLRLLEGFGADGIDLDWEYPGIEGYPGHPWASADKQHFSELVAELRRTLGARYEISFAAGGFDAFFDHSVEWEKVMPLVDRVNIMSYDLVNGFSTVTGHHTPLFSTPQQTLSAEYGVRYLERLGVPRSKMVIGAAFYARVWENVDDVNHGLYQSGKFAAFIPYEHFAGEISTQKGYVFYRDSLAQAPWAYNPDTRRFATFDDRTSVARKTAWAQAQGLGGIMFWQLVGDMPDGGLLDAIHTARYSEAPKR